MFGTQPNEKYEVWPEIKLPLKLAENEQTQSKSRKRKLSAFYGWQRDLVEFSIS
jgi:hypothetical protein